MNKRKGKRHRPITVCADPMRMVMNRVRTLTNEERDTLLTAARTAFEEFRFGRGAPRWWRSLADAVNISNELMSSGLANDHAATFERASDALRAVAERHAERGSWTLNAAELDALDLLVNVNAVQIMNCSLAEFCSAVERVQRRVRGARNGNNVTAIAVEGDLK